MFCSKCGKELEENARFCTGCGAAVEVLDEKGTTLTDAENAAPKENRPEPVMPVEQPPVGESQAEPAAPAEAADPAPVAEPEKQGRSKMRLVGMAAAALVLVAVVAGICALLGGSGKSNMVAYVNDDYELMLLKNLKEGTEAVELSDEANSMAAFTLSPDGKYVYFREFDEPEMANWEDSTLMRMETSRIGKEDAKAEKVDSNVWSFSFLDDGRVFYKKGTDDFSVFDFCLFDGKEKQRLARDAVAAVTDAEEKYLYYLEREDDQLTLSRIALDGKGTEERLLRDVDTIWSAWTDEVLLYGEYDDEGSYTVYTRSADGTETKLLENVAEVYEARAEGSKVSFHYTVRNSEETTLYNYVKDPYAAEDAAMLEQGYPEYPEYPYYSDFEPAYLLDEGDMYTGYVTQIGEEVPFEDGYRTSDFSAAADMAYAMCETKWEEAMVVYEELERAYEEACNAYYEAEQRQYLRDELKNWDYDSVSFSLFRYEDGESVELAVEVDCDNHFVVVDQDMFLYGKRSADAETVAEIDDLSYAGEVYDRLTYGQEEDDKWYLNIGGVESEMEFDTRRVAYLSSAFVLNDEEILLAVSNGEETVLEAYRRKGNTLEFQSVVSDECTGGVVSVRDGKEALFFWEDYDFGKEEGDLICYVGGNTTTIAKGVSECWLLEDNAGVYTLGEMDYSEKNGTVYELCVQRGEDWAEITDECSGMKVAFPKADQVLYLADGDLWFYDGAESRRVAKDVLTFWAYSMAYSKY